MDKNTLTGLLLIGAVLIGFTWFSKPDPTKQADPSQAPKTELAQPTSSPSTAVATTTLDSTTQATLPRYAQPRAEQTIELKNKKVSIKLSTKGAAPQEVVLADYLDQTKKPVHLFRKGDARFNLPLRTAQNTLVNTADAYFDLVSQTDSTATLRMQLDSVAYLDFVYSLRPDDYRLNLTLSGNELRRLLPVNMTVQDVEWTQRIPQQEQSWKFEG